MSMGPKVSMGQRGKREGQAPHQAGRLRLPWPLMLAAALVAVGALVALTARPAEPSSGVITADQSRYDFGEVSMSGGTVFAQFPLMVDGAPLVTALGTT